MTQCSSVSPDGEHRCTAQMGIDGTPHQRMEIIGWQGRGAKAVNQYDHAATKSSFHIVGWNAPKPGQPEYVVAKDDLPGRAVSQEDLSDPAATTVDHQARQRLSRERAKSYGACGAQMPNSTIWCSYPKDHPPLRETRPGHAVIDRFDHGDPIHGEFWNAPAVKLDGGPDDPTAVQMPGSLGPSPVGEALRRDELAQWWLERAEAEIGQTVDKAIQYGAADLIEIGRQLVAAGARLPDGHRSKDDAEYFAELGIWFYLVGKLARWTSAISEGRQVSTDTMLDIGVYVRMAQRVRETGRWP